MRYGNIVVNNRLALGLLAACLWCAASTSQTDAKGGGGGGHGGGGRSAGSNTHGPVAVKGYTRGNGTVVAPYSRSLPGTQKNQSKRIDPRDRFDERTNEQRKDVEQEKDITDQLIDPPAASASKKKADVHDAPKAKQPSSGKSYYATVGGYHYFVENGVYGMEPIRPSISQRK